MPRLAALLMSIALLSGCHKDTPEDDYQMPPLPQYDPNAPARPFALPAMPLPGYQQVGPVIPVAPKMPPGAADGGTSPGLTPDAKQPPLR